MIDNLEKEDEPNEALAAGQALGSKFTSQKLSKNVINCNCNKKEHISHHCKKPNVPE